MTGAHKDPFLRVSVLLGGYSARSNFYFKRSEERLIAPGFSAR